jgi:hypothetical protein
VILGLGAALALSRLMASLTFCVDVHDPLVFVWAAIVFSAVALFAIYPRNGRWLFHSGREVADTVRE